MPTYRVELAKSNRSTCKNPQCQKAGTKIEKGELRFGNLVEIQGNSSYHWKHFGCLTPQQIETWKEISEDNMDLVDGYEELPSESQEKVARAFRQGHVDDEDWKGDIEKNRPGEKGFFLTPKQKAAKEAEEGGDDADVSNASAKKPQQKKRKKGEEDEDDNEDKEAKTSKKAKKVKSKKNEDDIKEEKDDEDAGVKDTKPAASKKQAKSKTEDTNDGVDESSKAKGKNKKPKSEEPEPEAVEPDTNVKRGRGRPKKQRTSDAADKVEKPKSGRSRGRPKKIVNGD